MSAIHDERECEETGRRLAESRAFAEAQRAALDGEVTVTVQPRASSGPQTEPLNTR